MVSSLVSKLSMKVSVSVSVSIFGSAWYQYQYQYRNFRPTEYQYRIGIEFVDQESISIVSVSEKVVSKGSDMHAPDCTGAMTSNSFALHVRRKYFVN